MGTFVSVSEGKVGLDDMHDQIDQTILYTRTYADEMRGQLSIAINDLKDIVGEYNPDVIKVDTSVTPIDRPSFPGKPLLPDYEATCLLDSLIPKICTGILEGGNGLTEVVYNAIVAREQNARQINQDREYHEGIDSVGSDGFDLPSGHVSAVQLELSEVRATKDQDSINNLVVKDFDLATDNTRFMVTSGMELEKILRASWDSAADRVVDMYKVEMDGVVSEYQALVSWVGAEVERIKMEATIAIENGRLGLEAYTALAKLASSISEAIANIASQSIASALGAINTSLSNTYSGTENRQESWSHGETLSETHTFEEL